MYKTYWTLEQDKGVRSHLLVTHDLARGMLVGVSSYKVFSGSLYMGSHLWGALGPKLPKDSCDLANPAVHESS